MRFIRLTSLFPVFFSLAVAPYLAAEGPDLSADAVTVGRHLQADTFVKLGNGKMAPKGGLVVTVTSDDPSRLLLSTAINAPGSASISLTIPGDAVRSHSFAVRALADSGSATYTISAPGFESAKGSAILTPSAIVIVGPHKAPRMPTTPRGEPGRVSLVAAAVDATGNILESQPLAGGSSLEITISNSNPAAVRLQDSKLVLPGGSDEVTTHYQPVSLGEATLAPDQPPGFFKPAARASIVVAVEKPGLAIAGDTYLGKDLQSPVSLVLGEPAPPGGLKVTLKSADPSRLLLSAAENEVGSGSLEITVPAGHSTATYVIQALGDSGQVEYTATAPGFRTRTAPIALTKSGMILAYQGYGPPDEANVKRKIGPHNDRPMFVSLADAKKHPVRLVVYSAYIDPETGRSADFTVQPLRAGVSATVVVKSSDPNVATIDSPLTMKSALNQAICEFKPLSAGKTTVSIDTPAGFSTPGNATAVPATVMD